MKILPISLWFLLLLQSILAKTIQIKWFYLLSRLNPLFILLVNFYFYSSFFKFLGSFKCTPLRYTSNFDCGYLFCENKSKLNTPIQSIKNIKTGPVKNFFGSAFIYPDENLNLNDNDFNDFSSIQKHHLKKNHKHHKQNDSIFASFPIQSSFPSLNSNSTSGPIGKCSCKKTQCNKLYCECFSNKRFCDETCQCVGCTNKPEEISPKCVPFKSNRSLSNYSFIPLQEEKENFKGCTCTKSNCNKLYCDCHKNGRKCSTSCRCVNCLNFKEYEKFTVLESEHFDISITNNFLCLNKKIQNELSPSKKDNIENIKDFSNKKRKRYVEQSSSKKTEAGTEKKTKHGHLCAMPKNLFKHFKTYSNKE